MIRRLKYLSRRKKRLLLKLLGIGLIVLFITCVLIKYLRFNRSRNSTHIPVQIQKETNSRITAIAPISIEKDTSSRIPTIAPIPIEKDTSSRIPTIAPIPIEKVTSSPISTIASIPIEKVTSSPISTIASIPTEKVTSSPISTIALVPIQKVTISTIPPVVIQKATSLRITTISPPPIEKETNKSMKSSVGCGDLEIVGKNFIEPRSTCGDNQNYCAINKNYQNKIKYFQKMVSINLEFLSENLVMVLRMKDDSKQIMIICMTIWDLVPGMNIIINHPTMSQFHKDFLNFVRKNKDNLKYITPLGEFNVGVYGKSSYHDNKLSYLTKKYVLIMDKNFMIGDISLLIKLVEILESTDASIVGGKYGGQAIKQCDSFGIFYTSINHNKTILIQNNGKAHEAITGFENCYKVDTMKNFFVAKTKSLLIGDAINYVDHEYANDDFFLRQIYMGRKVVWCGDIIPYQKEYSSVKFDHNHPKSKAWISDHGFDEIIVN